MKSIFHSLGTNYSWKFVALAAQQLLFIRPASLQQLTQLLESKYHGQAYLLYKGRDAIEFALRANGIGKDDQVLTQAFTCHAIEEAIERAGAAAVFVDLARNQLNPSLATLQAAYKKAPRAKAVLVQHTLGYPAEIQKIAQWCKSNQLVLIEDLAQAVGAQDADGTEVGTYGDVVICSFGRDKVIDAVSGGAVIFKTNSSFFVEGATKKTFTQFVKPTVPARFIKRDMIYPLLTWVIRHTHQFLIGKVLFQITKRIGFLTSPISSPLATMAALPAAYAPLILWRFQHLSQQLAHRREIGRLYDQLLKNGDEFSIEKISASSDDLTEPSFLRYAFSVPQPTELARTLLQSKIYLTDRWYREAVDCGTLKLESAYIAGNCPEAEKRAEHIFNLPTHRSIRTADAQRIVNAIIDALKVQT